MRFLGRAEIDIIEGQARLMLDTLHAKVRAPGDNAHDVLKACIIGLLNQQKGDDDGDAGPGMAVLGCVIGECLAQAKPEHREGLMRLIACKIAEGRAEIEMATVARGSA